MQCVCVWSLNFRTGAALDISVSVGYKPSINVTKASHEENKRDFFEVFCKSSMKAQLLQRK